MSNILIIDDEIENSRALKRSLGDENPTWNIFIANDEDSGMMIIKEQFKVHAPVDVVITDLVMSSDDSGMKILRDARKIDPLIMAILFTAKEQNLDRFAAFDLGAFDVVEKNIRGTSASREINIKARAALQYRQWSQKINFLSRYFDPKIFDAIDKDPSLLEMSSRLVTVVFWDIRGFSRLCEILKGKPPLISEFLKEYSEISAMTIFKHGGVLDKFIGDGVMALFGAMNRDETTAGSDALAAIEAAKALNVEFENLLAKWKDEWRMYVPDQIDIGLGCGMHTGEALVGNVGASFREQFTALGPSVNFASRIESRSKHREILLSQSTQLRVREHVQTELADTIDDIKNIPGKFDIYRVKY